MPSIESRQRHAQTNLAHEDRAQEGSSCEFLHSKGFLEAVGAAHPDDRCQRIPAGTLFNARLDACTYRIELVITRSGRRSSRQTLQRPAGVKSFVLWHYIGSVHRPLLWDSSCVAVLRCLYYNTVYTHSL